MVQVIFPEYGLRPAATFLPLSDVEIQAFAPFVSTIRGIDISNGMVEQYNAAALGHGIPRAQMHAVQGDLLANSESLNDPDISGFHVIVMSMALHHVEDPAQMISKLAERLKSDGSLVIIDWVTPAEGGLFGPPDFPAAHTVTRHGFKEEEIRKMFTAAGLSLGYLLHPRRSKVPPELGGEQQLFFARGRALVNTSTP